MLEDKVVEIKHEISPRERAIAALRERARGMEAEALELRGSIAKLDSALASLALRRAGAVRDEAAARMTATTAAAARTRMARSAAGLVALTGDAHAQQAALLVLNQELLQSGARSVPEEDDGAADSTAHSDAIDGDDLARLRRRRDSLEALAAGLRQQAAKDEAAGVADAARLRIEGEALRAEAAMLASQLLETLTRIAQAAKQQPPRAHDNRRLDTGPRIDCGDDDELDAGEGITVEDAVDEAEEDGRGGGVDEGAHADSGDVGWDEKHCSESASAGAAGGGSESMEGGERIGDIVAAEPTSQKLRQAHPGLARAPASGGLVLHATAALLHVRQ